MEYASKNEASQSLYLIPTFLAKSMLYLAVSSPTTFTENILWFAVLKVEEHIFLFTQSTSITSIINYGNPVKSFNWIRMLYLSVICNRLSPDFFYIIADCAYMKKNVLCIFIYYEVTLNTICLLLINHPADLDMFVSGHFLKSKKMALRITSKILVGWQRNFHGIINWSREI